MSRRAGACALVVLLGLLVALPASALGLRTATRAERLALTPLIADHSPTPRPAAGWAW